jgi:hypothetical protein
MHQIDSNRAPLAPSRVEEGILNVLRRRLRVHYNLRSSLHLRIANKARLHYARLKGKIQLKGANYT